MKFSTEKLFWLLYAGIVLYGFYCYNPFVLYFQNDDFIHISLSEKGVLFQRNSFRPVCDLSVMADHYLYGKNAAGYHLTNLILHVVCGLLVYLFSKRIITRYFPNVAATKAALFVSALFFVYATHSEAVLWILGRSAIIGLIFSLLFLLQYLKRELTILSIVSYTLFLFLALLSYESSFILPVLAVLLFLIDKKKNDKTHLAVVITSFLVYLAARIYVTGEIYGKYEVGNIGGAGLLTVVANYAKLVMRSFIPAYTQGVLIVGLFSMVALTVMVLFIKNRKRKPVIALAIMFLISLLPYCSLGIDAHGYEGERYLYFPGFLLSLLIVLLLAESFRNSFQLHVAVLVILFVHAASLHTSAKNFRLAGDVNRLTIGAVEALPPSADTLYVNQLPQAQNGALILRDGLEEAVKWVGSSDSLKVVIRSRRSEWDPLREEYKLAVENSNASSADKAEFNFTDSVLRIKY